MNPKRWKRRIGWGRLAGLAMAGACLCGAVRSAPEPGQVVELPPFEVRDNVETRPWQYGAVAGAEVLTRCSDETTADFMEAEDRVEQLFRAMVPAEFQLQLAVPRVFILTDKKTTATSSQELIDRVNPRADEGKTPERSAPTGRRNAFTPVELSRVRFMPNLRLGDIDTMAVYAILEEGGLETRRLSLTTSHMQLVLQGRTPQFPMWAVRGLTQVCEKLEFNYDELIVNPADWTTPAEAERIKDDADYPRTLLTAQELFEGAPPRVESDEAGGRERRWRLQSALFVRWALDGDENLRAAFWKFVARASVQPVNEAFFRECFGMGYADLRDRLSDYLPVALKNTIRIKPEKIVKLPAFRLRLATPTEIGRIKGDWERLELLSVKALHPEFQARYEEQASRTLARAGHGDDDVRLLAVKALFECDIGHDQEALPLLEAVAQTNIIRPRVYVELARLRFAEAMKKPAGSHGRISTAQANAVLAPLITAHGQKPPLAPAYELAAEVWTQSDAKLATLQLDMLDEGLQLFPNQLSLLYRVAVVKWINGLRADALTLVDRGVQISRNAAGKAGFMKLRLAIEAQESAMTAKGAVPEDH